MAVVSLAAVKRMPANPRRRSPEIIDAAARVFAQRGFHGASTQDIADVLGIRQASLYYYFSSKEEALELVCLQGVAGFVEAAQSISAASGTTADKLSGLVRSHLAPFANRADYVRVFLNDRQHLPAESRRRIGKWSRALERIYEDILQEGVRRGELRADLDTRVTVLAILGMTNAVAHWHRNEAIPLTHVSEEFIRLLLEGALKAPKRKRRRR